MKLRISIRPQSGERDQEFTTTFDGARYTVGPEPVEVSEFVGKYLIGSFSGIMEIVPEPVPEPVVEEPVIPVVIPKVKRATRAKRSPNKASPKKK